MAENKKVKEEVKTEVTEGTKVETPEVKDEGTKVEPKDVLPESLSTDLKGESKGPEFKVANAKAGVIEKAKTVKIIRN